MNSVTNIQVESSLILLTFNETLKFINNKAGAKLLSIKDATTDTAVWGQGGGHITTDIDFKFFVLVFNKPVDIKKFQDNIKGGFLGGKFKFSIVNIQIPWSEKRTTADDNKRNRTNANGTNAINTPGAYRIEQEPNGTFSATVKNQKGAIKKFTGKSEKEVDDKVTKFMNP